MRLVVVSLTIRQRYFRIQTNCGLKPAIMSDTHILSTPPPKEVVTTRTPTPTDKEVADAEDSNPEVQAEENLPETEPEAGFLGDIDGAKNEHPIDEIQKLKPDDDKKEDSPTMVANGDEVANAYEELPGDSSNTPTNKPATPNEDDTENIESSPQTDELKPVSQENSYEKDKSSSPVNVEKTQENKNSHQAKDGDTSAGDLNQLPSPQKSDPAPQQTTLPSTAPHPEPPPATAETRQPTMLMAKTATPERTMLSSTYSATDYNENIINGHALSIVWSFGQNKNVPMVNLSTDTRSIIVYACAHTGICYNYESNTQKLLQGHNNNISCICVSDDKKWLATADKGPGNCMVIIWDTSSFFPVQTLFDAGEQGVTAMSLTPDARYLVTISAGLPQMLCIWDWTIEGDHALCSATLDPSYGVQDFVLFNPDDTTQIVSNSESQAIFYSWENGQLEYYCPPLTDDDFNKPVGKYTQSIFLENSNKCLTATSIGNLVVWASNKPLTKAVDNEPTPNKKALKLVKVQDRGINVLKMVDSKIVMGDVNGHVKLFDQSLNLIHWYQDLHIGPINSISFTYIEKWGFEVTDQQDYPGDCSLDGRALPIRDFVLGSTHNTYAKITPRGTDINIIHRNHDSPIHAIVTHPSEKRLYIGSYSGLLQVWDYEAKKTVATRKFDKHLMIQCLAIDSHGHYIAVGFTNGCVKILDALNLTDEGTEVFRYARDAITHIKFSHDAQYLATADGEFTTTLFKRVQGTEGEPWVYVGRHKAHYKEIKDLNFGVDLDSNKPRLLTLGKDRALVEYDLENSSKDNLLLSSVDKIEQSAIPLCFSWYPPLNKEHFIVTANDQYKFKLYNVTTKRCRKTTLGPTYGSPPRRICVLPTGNEVNDRRYIAYINDDKIGLQILPLDGNPHNSMALIAHPGGVSHIVPSCDGKYLFSAGGSDTTVHMWHVNVDALEAQAKLGGDDLIPFYGLMEGGREGELFAELEDYFYYAQLRNQGINTMMQRDVDTKIPLSEVPFVMRAMGFYPSEQEVEDMLNEVKFSRYVETGQDVTEIDLGGFIRLYINHRPAFGLSHEKIAWCFEILSGGSEEGTVKRGNFLDLLQRKGEHMTEYELSEYLTTLLGYNEEGGSCEQHQFDAATAGNIIMDNLPTELTTMNFIDDLLGFGLYANQQPDILKIDNN